MVESSQQIVIKPRRQEEMAFFDWDRSFFERGPFNRQDMERIISELTPGTMRNLLKYDLLLTELMDIILSTPKQEDVETEIFESLEKTESFLNTLHEIERENLRRAFSLKHRLSFERQMRNNEKLLSKFSEMFGKSVPLRRPADFTGGMGGPPGARMWLVP